MIGPGSLAALEYGKGRGTVDREPGDHLREPPPFFLLRLDHDVAHERLQHRREAHAGFMNPTGSEVSPSVARSASASP